MSAELLRKEMGRELRRLRIERGLKQDEIAPLAGLHRKTVGDVERGKSDTFSTYHALCAALGIPMAWLIKWAEGVVQRRKEAA